MKKLTILAAVLAAVMLMTGCRQSVITAEGQNGVPAGNMIAGNTAETQAVTMHPTEEYTIPEGATGPADVVMEDPQQYYPDSFQTAKKDNEIQFRFFYVNSTGLHEEFGLLYGEECTPELLVEGLMNEGVLAEGTEVVSFQADGDEIVLELNQLAGCSDSATPELLAQAVANTFIDNLNVETAVIKVKDGGSYGPLEYKDN